MLQAPIAIFTPGGRSLDIRIFPNPASSMLYVHGRRGLHKPLYAELVSLSGIKARTGKSSNDDFSLSLIGLSPGIYVFRLFNGYGAMITTEKIIVNN